MKENTFKLIATSAFTAIIAYFGILAVPLVVLLAVMLFDYCTGMAAAYLKGSLSSKKGWRGILKKTCYIAAVGVGVVLDYIITKACVQLSINVGTFFYFGLLVTVWLILNELLSIIENLGEIGVPLPEWLEKAIEKITTSVDEKADGNQKK